MLICKRSANQCIIEDTYWTLGITVGGGGVYTFKRVGAVYVVMLTIAPYGLYIYGNKPIIRYCGALFYRFLQFTLLFREVKQMCL